MSSCLYECDVMHARFAPREHRFVYRLFLFAIDLDELAALHHRLPLFSVNRANLYSFRESDYLPTHEPLHPARDNPNPICHLIDDKPRGLKARVVGYLAAQGVDLTGGRVVLVTLPRIFGYLFNPVSFYFCYDRHGACVATLAEVTNTFREMKPYFLGPSARADGAFRLRVPKHFYVSPFSDVDVEFDFMLRPPDNRLAVQIDDHTGGRRTLTSTLTGPRRALTGARLAWFTVKYPLLTLRIIALIHWHALLLWLKRVPWFTKAGRAAEQRDLYRPHASIAQPQDVA
ncbi:MAG TPA: DUF1365 domain-containing protein [Opitutaceae bacterium]|nr:DUF1365 domain-containing protein [Opitutaceae bacterium]HRJ47568.1 DUF1365 domain-containing protein [Opitutaceae bacterium]